MALRLNFRKPISTRSGSNVRIYHIYTDYIHGAYENNGDWFIAAWTLNGYFLPPRDGKQHRASIDLVNEEPYEQQAS